MRVGFVYNVRRVHLDASGENDHEAEFDDPAALDAIRAAIAAGGHEVVGLEADETLPAALAAAHVDVVFNIAEGTGPRSREAHVPALLELLGIPYTGSDAVTLGVALDKSLAKTLARAAGVAAPGGIVMVSGSEPLPEGLRFPVIAKPLHEGSSKGITQESVVSSESDLREQVRAQISRYRQPVLCEEYVAGREITVGLLGSPARVLPPMEIVFLDETAIAVYSFEVKQRPEDFVRYDVPATLTAGELEAVERASLLVFGALGCRDVARIDLRLDAAGTAHFLECNPLPGLAPDGASDLPLIAAAAGIGYEDLIEEILAGALRRTS